MDLKAKVSKYFTWGEFLKTDTGVSNEPDATASESIKQLAAALDVLREKFGAINIISGYRGPNVQAALIKSGNQQVAENSLHTLGKAADITMPGYSVQKAFATVASDPSLTKLFGEFAVKNTVLHVSLPTATKQGLFMWVDEKDKYNVFTPTQLQAYIKNPILPSTTAMANLFKQTSAPTQVAQVVAPSGTTIASATPPATLDDYNFQHPMAQAGLI